AFPGIPRGPFFTRKHRVVHQPIERIQTASPVVSVVSGRVRVDMSVSVSLRALGGGNLLPVPSFSYPLHPRQRSRIPSPDIAHDCPLSPTSANGNSGAVQNAGPPNGRCPRRCVAAVVLRSLSRSLRRRRKND